MNEDRSSFMSINLERERCEKIVIDKIQGLIFYRQNRIKHKSRQLVGTLNKLQRDILFKINNPDYVRKQDRGLLK